MVDLSDRERAVLERLMPTWPVDAVHADYLPGGYSNTNYRLRYGADDCVLRIVDATRVMPNVDRAREYMIITGPAAKLSPPLVKYELPAGHMVTRFVVGPRIDETRLSAATLAAFLTRLHEDLPMLPSPYAPDDVIRAYVMTAERLGTSTPPLLQRAVERFRWQPEDVVSCHNDLNPWNVIVASRDPAGWVTLDWEHAGMNDRWFDVCGVAIGLRQTVAETRDLIERYAGQNNLPVPRRDRWRAIQTAFMLRELAWAHLQRAMGNTRAEVVTQLEWAMAALGSLDE